MKKVLYLLVLLTSLFVAWNTLSVSPAHALCIEDVCKADVNYTKADFWCEVATQTCKRYQCVSGNDAECQGTLAPGARNLGPGFICNPTTFWCERPLGNVTIAGNKLTGYTLTGTGLRDLINNVTFAVGVIVGLIFFAMLVMGGIGYMMSSGDEKQLTKAKQQITAGLIGLVIVFMAWWVVKIVGIIFGINILQPSFTGP